MTGFEYKVVPAPLRGLKGKGIKGTPARFANALQLVMNDLGAQGWECQRTDPTSRRTRRFNKINRRRFKTCLVFRRALEIQRADGPEVTALIEDQTSEIEAPDAPKPYIEMEHVAAQAQDQGSTSEEPSAQSTKVIVAPVPLARDDRVSATLAAPFTFPWDKRRASAQAPKDDDSQVRSEQ
jgi:hypothetical protein